MKAKQILKYSLPAVAPLGMLAIAVVFGNRTLPTQIKSTQSEISGKSTVSGSATAPSVTVNGQSIPVPPNGTTHVDTGKGRATVSVSGGGGNTSSQTNDGDVSISVNSSSNNSSSTTHTVISGSSSETFTNNSSIRVQTNGTGSVSVTD